MNNLADAPKSLAERLIASCGEAPTSPAAYYDPHGDCVRFFLSNESYKAERVDDLLTVFYGRESGEIVGSLIKGVDSLMESVSAHAPGFKLEVEDGRVRLEHLITAGMWSRGGEEIIVKKYKRVRDFAEKVEVALAPPARPAAMTAA